MRRPAVALMLVALFWTIASCSPSGTETSTDDGGFGDIGGTTETEIALPSLDPDWFLALLDNADTTDTSPTTTLTDAQFDAMLDSISAWAAPSGQIAQQLNTVDPSWGLTSSDLETFASGVCFDEPVVAAQNLLAQMPGARLSALPALNQATGLVYQTCDVTNPSALDLVSDEFVAVTTSNESVATTVLQPPSLAGQSDGAISIYDASCATGGAGLGYWATNKVKSGGRGGFLLAVALAGATLFCPQVAKDIFETP